jgi:hypothetical protein
VITMTIPPELYDELKVAADARGTTVVELLRKMVKLGLIALAIEADPDAALIVREGERERELVLM